MFSESRNYLNLIMPLSNSGNKYNVVESCYCGNMENDHQKEILKAMHL